MFVCDDCLEIMPLDFLKHHKCCSGSVKENQTPNLNISSKDEPSKVSNKELPSVEKIGKVKKNKKQRKRFGSKWFFKSD